VELVISSGKPIAEIARDLGIGDGTLGNWVKAAKKRGELKEKPLEIGSTDVSVGGFRGPDRLVLWAAPVARAGL
uniref:transposase n=1 Tax=Candidatus Mycobacterium methanotrophicum TaxID=2943498 RepID=UPI001C5A4A5F